MKPIIRYSIDVFKRKHISGWCYNRLKKNDPVTLTFRIDDSPLGSVTADMFREDLKAQNIHPTGKCGFQFLLPFDYELQSFQTISIFSGNSKSPLTVLNKKDVFKTVDKKRGIFNRLRNILSGQKQPPVFFMHIPKTAGTSFNSFARKLYPDHESISHIKSYDSSEYLEFQKRYRYISGHLTFGEIQRNFDINTLQLISILREPIGHLHSHLSWIKRVGAKPDGDYFKRHNNTIQNVALKLNNYDFSTPRGIYQFLENLEGLEFDLFDNGQSRFFLSKRPDKVREYHFEEMKNNFQMFSQIGFTEKYPEFEEEFCNRHGFTCPQKEEKHLNKSRSAPLFDKNDPDILEAIYPLIEIDLKLYSYAKENFFTL